jgi:hypothetical protein
MLDDGNTGCAPGSDGLVQFVDRRLFEGERLFVGYRLAPCTLGS